MSFANPWGLLALGAVPIIIALHMFHRRFPAVRVAGLHLWGTEQETRAPGRRRDRLPITLSLFLEVLAAILAALVLSQPQVQNLTTVDHLVVVLDDSASMSATLEGGESIRDAAIDEIRSRVEELGDDTVCTLLKTGVRPESLTGAPLEWNEALELLESWEPSKPAHDFQSTWDVAAQVAGEDGHLLFVTNRMPSDMSVVPGRMQVAAIGSRRDNMAFELARWRQSEDQSGGQIYFRVANKSRTGRSVRVTGLSGSDVVIEKTLTIPGQESRSAEVAVASGLGEIELVLEADSDSLEIDNRVTLLEPGRRQIRYSIDLPPDHPADSLLRRVLENTPQAVEADAASAAFMIGPAARLPESKEHLWWLGIGPISLEEEVQAESLDLAGPFLLQRRSPLLDGVVLGGIFWGGAQTLPWEADPLVSSDQLVLFGRVLGTKTSAYVMNIDLKRTNLGNSPDWPILMTNLIEQCRDDQPGFKRWNYRLNEVIRARLPRPEDSNAPLKLVAPDEQERMVARDRADVIELRGLYQPGVYRLFEGEGLVQNFSVNFYDPIESDLSRLETGTRLPETDGNAGFRLEGAYNWLLLLGVVLIAGCLLADWYVIRQASLVRWH